LPIRQIHLRRFGCVDWWEKGGIGLRGPGETQLETDKRLIAIRIKNISKRLEKVHKQRDLGRKSRLKNELPMISSLYGPSLGIPIVVLDCALAKATTPRKK
jgi:50S ribosomal subunit-associated GTPase HflX